MGFRYLFFFFFFWEGVDEYGRREDGGATKQKRKYNQQNTQSSSYYTSKAKESIGNIFSTAWGQSGRRLLPAGRRETKVNVRWLGTFGRASHGDDTVRYVSQIQIKGILFIPDLQIWPQNADMTWKGRLIRWRRSRRKRIKRSMGTHLLLTDKLPSKFGCHLISSSLC